MPSFGIIAFMLAFGVLLEHLQLASPYQWIVLAIAVLPLCFYRDKVQEILTSYQFAVSLLTTICIAVILGTFLLQNPPPGQAAYGKFTGLIQFFFLDHVFKSIWFNLFLAVLATGLVFVLIKRKPFRLTQAGFLFSHVGVILILAGGLIGRMFGGEGFIDLHEGKSATAMHELRNGSYTNMEKDLGFEVKLEDFQIDYYDAEYKLYAFSFDPAVEDYRGVASYELKKNKSLKVPGRNTSFQIDQIKNTTYTETDPTKPGQHFLSWGNETPLEVEVGRSYRVSESTSVEVVHFVPHFSYDIDQRKVVNVSNSPNNPAILLRITKGGTSQEKWLFANMPDFHKVHQKTENSTDENFLYAYELPKQTKKEVPVLTLLVETPSGIVEQQLAGDATKPLFLEEGKVALVLDKREGEVKEYRSIATVKEDGKQVRKQTIAVNHPLKYAGYSFYQSNYRPEDPTYSGLRVVKDPGLSIVYTGASILCLGVVWIFYITPGLIRTKRRRQELVKENENVTR